MTFIGRMQADRIQVVPLDRPRSLKLFPQTPALQVGCPRTSNRQDVMRTGRQDDRFA